MNPQDIIRTGYKAKSETEDFINRYLNDQAKGWPRVCFCNSVYAEYSQGRRTEQVLRAGARQS